MNTSWNQVCGQDINNLWYADAAALIAESEEELKNLLMRMKEERGGKDERGKRKTWLKSKHSEN